MARSTRLKPVLTLLLIAIPSGIAWASQENPYNDENTIGMAVLRFITVLINTFQLGVITMMLFGLILVASGITLWIRAPKLQISPSTGFWTMIVGFTLCSPMGCAAMASNEILKQPATIFTELGSQSNTATAEDYIQPNK